MNINKYLNKLNLIQGAILSFITGLGISLSMVIALILIVSKLK